MKRMLMALAAAAGVGVFVGFASADPGGFAPPKPGSAPSLGTITGPGTLFGAGDVTDRPPDCHGFCPAIKRLFRGGGGNTMYGSKNPLANPANWSAGGYGMGGPAYNPQGFPPGAYGPAQGTLVFPHQPFVRSPRDYFMMDLNK